MRRTLVAGALFAVALWLADADLAAAQTGSPCCDCACIDDGDGDAQGERWRCVRDSPPDLEHCNEELEAGDLVLCAGGDATRPLDGVCLCAGDTCSAGSPEACAAVAAQACFDAASAVACDDDGASGPDPCDLGPSTGP